MSEAETVNLVEKKHRGGDSEPCRKEVRGGAVNLVGKKSEAETVNLVEKKHRGGDSEPCRKEKTETEKVNLEEKRRQAEKVNLEGK
nr:hypothetical protein BgiMline_006929 [Biomphalaria glabrata]